MFTSANRNLDDASLTNLLDAPSHLNVLGPTTLAATATGPDDLSITPNLSLPPGYGAIIKATPTLHPGRAFFNPAPPNRRANIQLQPTPGL